MKKVLILSSILATVLFANDVNPANLPADVKDFVAKNFDANITSAEDDFNSYELNLSDGTELDLSKKLVIKELENYSEIDEKLLPNEVVSAISSVKGDNKVVKFEKNLTSYEVTLSNGLEIDIKDGKITKQDFKKQINPEVGLFFRSRKSTSKHGYNNTWYFKKTNHMQSIGSCRKIYYEKAYQIAKKLNKAVESQPKEPKKSLEFVWNEYLNTRKD